MKKHKTFIQSILLMASVSLFGFLASCSSTDKYHNKRHLDTIKKDLDSAHRDTDHILGLDEPSILTEEK
ncbi:MAG: hypothetical protein DCC43_05995 [Candidatus Brocadia sp.]|uniref:Lipoprotein n=1 Tax=Candidatus Brocadia fulgida TaxID=380242 RepID=A0A0M2UZ08_9BACT|nr:MAG: hypothetical protein BROFUL_01051 [Candidatus Brocadia fulgida]MCC6324726.1 hypothetical protein [Candidatus Brocadia sp.]MCE7910562.1 hypothetical protein [Candidatus Brocadia sp. AMX3]OQZ00974.1 MAG: hypothetical protein B6D35_04680 [Candidatus Brocadia sp. UTAMX2]MBV6519205.1 hypothetical protein [Candidatus Brocadia fulgida]